MSTTRIHLGDDDGVAMYLVMMVMMVLLTLGAALSIGGHQSSLAVSNDELGVRALQAAEAGAQSAVHRLNMQQPSPSQCIRSTITVPQSGSTWCAPTNAETVASNASYIYQTSVEAPGSCTGSAFGTGTVERCVVATGSAGGVTRRVVQRVVSSSGSNPFPTNGVLGKDGVTITNNTTLLARVGTNGTFSMGNGSSVSGTVTLWTNAPAPSGYSGPVTRTPTQFVLAPPNMLNPSTLLDSKTSNDNGRLLAGGGDSCIGGSGTGGTCYTNTAGSPRTLSLGNQGSVTLGGGVYNFCQLNLGQGAALNVAPTAKVLIYIDSPDRLPNPGCVAGQGGITAGNNAIFSNPSGDPTALQIVIYGSTAYPSLEIPNNTALAAAIYAPNTNVSFKNNGSFTGGITAKTVTLKNNATWDARLAGFRFATTLVYYRGAWRQCPTRTLASATAPATGCL